jgi:hypothetical protein
MMYAADEFYDTAELETEYESEDENEQPETIEE